MKQVLSNFYIAVIVIGCIIAWVGSHQTHGSLRATAEEASRPNARFASGPTLTEAIMALDGRLEQSVDFSFD